MDAHDNIFALMRAAKVDLNRATAIIAALENEGFTIYRKKVFRNRRRPNSSTPMSDGLRARIIELHSLSPSITQSQIASALNVNAGRVAEVLAAYEG